MFDGSCNKYNPTRMAGNYIYLILRVNHMVYSTVIIFQKANCNKPAIHETKLNLKLKRNELNVFNSVSALIQFN